MFIQFSENSFQYNQIQVSHCGIKQSRNQNEKSFRNTITHETHMNVLSLKKNVRLKTKTIAHYLSSPLLDLLCVSLGFDRSYIY